jgi:Ca-activated chloride channel family protein
MMRLAQPALLLIGLLLLLPCCIRPRRAWLFSSVLLLPARRRVGVAAVLTACLTTAALGLMLIALAKPQRVVAHTHRTVEARDIILTLDLSLSMEGHIVARTESRRTERKLDVIRKAAHTFVQRHQHDRLGLIVFGDAAFGAWPLSTDSRTLEERLERLDILLPAELRGTHVANGLRKSLDHMQELGQSKTKIILMLTDGLDTISPQVEHELVQRIRKDGVKLYVLGLQLPSNSSIISLTRQAQGHYYDIQQVEALEAALRDVEQLETSNIGIDYETEYQELYAYFVLPGLLLWLASTVCKSMWVFHT